MALTDPDERAAIQEVHDLLDRVCRHREADGGFPDLLIESHPPNEIEISGNTDGLLWLAQHVLRVAVAGHPGYHEHIDAASFAREHSIPLVIGRLEQGSSKTEV